MEENEWFGDFLIKQQINLIEINPEIAFLSNKLPWHHRDPADRFIIATAMIHNLAIVSNDKKFSAYEVDVLN